MVRFQRELHRAMEVGVAVAHPIAVLGWVQHQTVASWPSVEIEQRQAHVNGLLERLCDREKIGPHKNEYVLKPAYKQ